MLEAQPIYFTTEQPKIFDRVLDVEPGSVVTIGVGRGQAEPT